MSNQFGRDNGNMAAGIFAATFVVIGGLLICTAVSFSFSDSPTKSYFIIGAIFFFLITLLYKIATGRVANGAASSNVFSILAKDKENDDVDYVPELKRKKQKSQTPPSVDQIRELKDGTNNWVPTGKTPKRKN